jgi:hypothetical protein
MPAMTRLQLLATLSVRHNDIGPVLDGVVDAAMAISGADFADVQLIDGPAGGLRIAAQHGFEQATIFTPPPCPSGRGS